MPVTWSAVVQLFLMALHLLTAMMRPAAAVPRAVVVAVTRRRGRIWGLPSRPGDHVPGG